MSDVSSAEDDYEVTAEERIARIQELIREAQHIGYELGRYGDAAHTLVDNLRQVCDEHNNMDNDLSDDEQQQQHMDDDCVVAMLAEDRLESQTETVKDEISKWKRQLEIGELCSAVRFNPTTVTKVEIKNPLDESLKSIGDSMIGNTHITEIDMNVYHLLDQDEETDNATSFIEFIRTSPSLVKVGMKLPSGYPVPKRLTKLEGLLLDAIAANPSIKELRLTGNFHASSFYKLMSTTTSLRILHFNCSDLCRRTRGAKEQKMILNSFASNNSVESLALNVCYDGEFSSVDKILGQMSNGQDKLTQLSLWDCRPPAEEFYTLLSSTRSLQTFEMDGFDWMKYTTAETSRVLDAFTVNQSIVNLELRGGMPIIDQILLRLHMGPSTLQKLIVSYSHKTVLNTLAQYLSHADTQLPYLELTRCFFDKDTMMGIVESIRAQESRPSTTTESTTTATTTNNNATQLTLKSCQFPEDAMHPFVAFIADQAAHNLNNYGSDAATTRAPLLYEPTTGDMEYTISPEFVDSQYACNRINVSSSRVSVASSLVSSQGVTTPQKQHYVSLSLCPFSNIPGFSNDLSTVAPYVGLVCLKLYHLSHADGVRLARCLPKLLSLRALHLVDIKPNVVTTCTIWNAMRRNGSVFTSSFTMKDKTLLFCDNDVHSKAISTYGQRNRVLTNMIVKQTVLGSTLSMGRRSEDNVRKKRKVDSTLVLVPSLFHVAKSIPLVRSRLFLSTLLVLDSSIGEQ